MNSAKWSTPTPDISNRCHTIKSAAPMFESAMVGTKTFEVRKDDRAYQRGDYVNLLAVNDRGEIDPTIDMLRYRIGFILRGGQFGLEVGYVAFSLLPLEASIDG